MKITQKRAFTQDNSAKRQKTQQKQEEALNQKIDKIIDKMIHSPKTSKLKGELLRGWLVLKGQIVPETLGETKCDDTNRQIEEGDTFLHIAIKLQQIELIRALIKLGMNPYETNAKQKTAFETVSKVYRLDPKTRKSYLGELCKDSLKLNEMEFSNLENMIEFVHINRSHLFEKIDINAQDEHGNTFLHKYFKIGISILSQTDPLYWKKGSTYSHLTKAPTAPVFHFYKFTPFNPNLTLKNHQGLTCYQVAAIHSDRFNYTRMLQYMKQTQPQQPVEMPSLETEMQRIASERMSAWQSSEKSPLRDFMNLKDYDADDGNPILKYLTIKDLYNISQVNWDSYLAAEQIIFQRAKKYGMESNEVGDAKDYIRNLFREIRLFQSKGWLPERVFAEDPEQTLSNLQTLTSDELIQIYSKLSCKEFILIKNYLPKNKRYVKTDFVQDRGNYALSYACKVEDIPVVKFLLELGVDPKREMLNPNDKHPLYAAASCGLMRLSSSFLIPILVKNLLKPNSIMRYYTPADIM